MNDQTVTVREAQLPVSGLAITSLVAGILWVFWVGSLVALICGYLARRSIKDGVRSGNGMALAGIVLGWIGVATWLLLNLAVFGLAAAG